MASWDGLEADVYFGDPTKPPVNWRDGSEQDDDGPDTITVGERRALTAMLGFDPAEMGEPVRGTERIKKLATRKR